MTTTTQWPQEVSTELSIPGVPCKIPYPAPPACRKAPGIPVLFIFYSWYKFKLTQGTSKKQSSPLLFPNFTNHVNIHSALGWKTPVLHRTASIRAKKRPWDRSAGVKIYWFQVGDGRMCPNCLPKVHVKLCSQFEGNKIKRPA